MKTINLIANATAARGLAKETIDKIKSWVGFQNGLSLQIHLTEREGHATDITKNLTNGANEALIMILGGDGTINEVLNGIVNFEKTTIGILPFGSANDFAYSIGLDNTIDPIELIKTYINQPKVIKIDYLLLNNKYRVINAVGIGMSAEVVNYRDHMKHFKPATQYKLASVIRGLFWKNVHCVLTIDSKAPKEIDTMWAVFANGKRVGSRMYVAPNAVLDDGQMDIMCINKFNRLTTPSVINKALNKKIDKIKTYWYDKAKQVHINANNIVVEFDGRLISDQSNITIKVVEKALNLLTR